MIPDTPTGRWRRSFLPRQIRRCSDDDFRKISFARRPFERPWRKCCRRRHRRAGDCGSDGRGRGDVVGVFRR